MAFEICRGEQAISCNAAGNDYDLVQCPLGCDTATGGCKECATNAECNGQAPICDVATSACRGCQVDSECASDVCDTVTGACVPESGIAYASATGSAVGSCTHTEPCNLTRALTVATTAAITPIVRMAPGSYTTPLAVSTPTAKPLVVLATGATIASASTTIAVTNGASVEIKDLTTLAPERQVVCGGAAGPISSLVIRNATIVKSALDFPAIEVERCRLELSAVKLLMNNTEVVVAASSDSIVHADRIDIEGTNNHYLMGAGQRVEMRVTNSLLQSTQLVLSTNDTVDPGSSFLFAFSTFADVIGEIDCTPAARRTVVIENSIITNRLGGDAITGVGCTLRKTILFPQSTALPGAVVVNPQFVAPAQRDYHLSSTSPAIDAAIATQTGLGLDLDGMPRPQGAAPDLGAYERKPQL